VARWGVCVCVWGGGSPASVFLSLSPAVSFAPPAEPPSRRAEYASFGQRYPVFSEPPVKVSEENA